MNATAIFTMSLATGVIINSITNITPNPHAGIVLSYFGNGGTENMSITYSTTDYVLTNSSVDLSSSNTVSIPPRPDQYQRSHL